MFDLLAMAKTASGAAASGSNFISAAGQMVRILFLFGLVVVLAYFTSRLLASRLRIRGEGRRLRILECVSLGGQRQLCLVQLGKEHLLLGVTDGGISLLGRAEESLDQAVTATSEPRRNLPGDAKELKGPASGFLALLKKKAARLRGRSVAEPDED